MSLSPQQVVDTADGLSGLIKILADTDAYQTKLNELKQYATDGMTAFENSQTNLAEAKNLIQVSKQMVKDADDAKEEYESKLASFDADMQPKLDSLSEREELVSAREIKADKFDKELDALSKSLNDMKANLTSQASAVKAANIAANEKMAEAMDIKSQAEALLAKLKAAVV